MKKFTYALSAFFAATLFISQAHADTIDQGEHGADIEARDIQALREWINTKRQVTVKEKGGALAISGEVRTEMQAAYEKVDGKSQRGGNTPLDLPHETFDVEVNVMLDYRADKAWASVKLEFDNNAGIFGGTLNRLKLERAYFGIRLIDWSSLILDAELGRRRINAFVDTKVEGDSFFDGIFLKYDQGFETIADFYVHAGTFVIDERRYHYGYLAELGLLDIADSGFYTKYLFIDWDTKHYKRTKEGKSINNRRFDFAVSQLLFGYKFLPKKFQKIVVLYIAGLLNHAARRLAITDKKLANWGAYTGFSIGELKKQGDWSLDINYQLLAAQVVPDFDEAGVGLGNAANAGFYTHNVNGTGGNTTRATASGNTNFRGYNITLEYLLTNNLVLFQSWSQSVTLDSDIGPFRHYKQYELEFNYAF